MLNLKEYWDPHVERCGVILQDMTVVELSNLSPNPTEGFEMDIEQVLALKPIATWHTHPKTSANLSAPDYLLYLQHPDLWHYIVGSAGETWCYFVEDGVVLLHEDPDQA
jgi:proteasome lid subunit RPN8/RPN11